MPTLVVPSDVTILEDRYSIGQRRLTVMERLGLFLTPPMFHFRYTKNDHKDYRKVLSRQYPTNSKDPIVELLVKRQKSIHSRVVAQNGLWDGAIAAAGLVAYSLRHYDYKTKLIVLPFVAYGGSFIGRWTADFVCGRWRESARSRILGQLPAKAYFDDAE